MNETVPLTRALVVGDALCKILGHLRPGEELRIRPIGDRLTRVSIVDTKMEVSIIHVCHRLADTAICALAAMLDLPSGEHESVRALIDLGRRAGS